MNRNKSLSHVEIAEQLKSDPTTNSLPAQHQGTGMPTSKILAFATNFFTPVLLTTRHLQKQVLQLFYFLKGQQTEVRASWLLIPTQAL